MTVVRTVAEYYRDDARHFLHRFRLLPPEEFNKAGRVKNFTDVVMAAECALKAHIFMASKENDAIKTYQEVRRMSHDISRLADRADFLVDRGPYEALKARLGEISIGLRYSLDMWETYFPFGDDGQPRLYDATVARSGWRNEAIGEVKTLLEALRSEPRIIDFAQAISDMREMEEFVRAVRIRD